MNHQIGVPAARINALNKNEVRSNGEYVLYWMTSARRTQRNFSLQRAVEWAVKLKRPLIILEALRCDYQWASDRFHTFIIQGMQVNATACSKYGVTYLPYIESRIGEGKGLLKALADKACVVIGDDFPAFFLRHMVVEAAKQINCFYETVDSNGLLPLQTSEKPSPSAYVFRRWAQKQLPNHLNYFPCPEPLKFLPRFPKPNIPKVAVKKWGLEKELTESIREINKLPIDHTVPRVSLTGGQSAAREQLKTFINQHLSRYHEQRNDVENSAASGLSPWLHFGHVSAHEIVSQVLSFEDWSPVQLSGKATGIREGWWGLSKASEAFLDQIITWRELGFHYCHHRSAHDTYEDLPMWAQQTLDSHADDPRPYVYKLKQFAESKTHDPLWNAAQRELVQTGVMHNYLRMLWGKKIIEWTNNPREALAIMTELNNRYALDGRDPNSSSGISWCLGRFDRPWMTRPIFGKIRYMTSSSTMKKINLKQYLQRFSDESTKAESGKQLKMDFE